MHLEVKNVCKNYNDADRQLTIINNLNFIFPSAGMVAILGRSGVGKSTLLQILGGLDNASSGEVILGDVDISSLSSDEMAKFRGENIGFIFQSHYLLRDFTALENISMPLIISGVSRREASDISVNALARVGLKDRKDHFSGQLSGGEQQRVAIARALVHNPSVILADEPTGSLDVRTGADIRELLISISKEGEKLIVVVTHSKELAEAADFVYEMLPGGQLQKAQI